MAQTIENNFPYVKDNKGINTNYPITAPQFIGGGSSVVVSGQAATTTILPTQSGNIFLFDNAAGIVYTLPAPTVGMRFTFITTISITSNAAKVITNTGTVLLIGALSEAISGGAANQYFGNGSTHISVSANGTTTGGLQGSRWEFNCVSSTLWEVSGWNNASGTIATPFSTS